MGIKIISGSPMTYLIKCYKPNGDLDHEEYAELLQRAEHIRAKWAKKNGITEFAYMPTIWKYNYPEACYERLSGY